MFYGEFPEHDDRCSVVISTMSTLLSNSKGVFYKIKGYLSYSCTWSILRCYWWCPYFSFILQFLYVSVFFVSVPFVFCLSVFLGQSLTAAYRYPIFCSNHDLLAFNLIGQSKCALNNFNSLLRNSWIATNIKLNALKMTKCYLRTSNSKNLAQV